MQLDKDNAELEKMDIASAPVLFQLPLKSMLKAVEQLAQKEYSAIMNVMPFSLAWIEAFKRRESLFDLLDFRINFELGKDAPLKEGRSAPHLEVATDLFARGWITQVRLDEVIRGERSQDYDLAMKELHRIEKEIADSVSYYQERGLAIKEDGRVELMSGLLN